MELVIASRGVVVLALALLPVACGKKSDVAQGQAARTLDTSSADPVAAIWHYTIDPTGRTHVELPGVTERITGDTSAADGTLDLVPSDLTKSRGSVRVDLATFTTTTFGNSKDQLQTKHARTWLEVQVGDQTNEPERFAEFAIRSIDASGPANLSALPIEKNGQEDVRRLALTLHGELLIHGHKVPKDAPVNAVFHYPSGAAVDTKPARVEVESAQPMQVALKEHDVRPRDPAGQLLEWTTALLSKVAETAEVTVHLSAIPPG